MLIVVIITNKLIIGKRFIIFLSVNASLTFKTRANRVENVDDKLNGICFMPISGVGSYT